MRGPRAAEDYSKVKAASGATAGRVKRPLRTIEADPEKIPRRMPPLARAAALLLAAAGCVLLVVAEFSTLYEIRVITVVKETTTGHENHAYALLVIALGAAFMTYGGIFRGARPAQIGLVVLALCALFVVFAIDYPDVGEEGFIGEAFERAKASPQTGFYLESLGAVLLLLAGAAAVLFGSGDADEHPADAS